MASKNSNLSAAPGTTSRIQNLQGENNPCVHTHRGQSKSAPGQAPRPGTKHQQDEDSSHSFPRSP